jgi:hypothetical protein
VVPTVSAAQTQVAPTVAAAQTQVAPTVSAAQTQVAPTVAVAVAGVQATATAAAPTAQAVATLVAPTVQAASTQVTGAVATSVAESTVHVTKVDVNPTDTTVTLQNSGNNSENLRGWTLIMGPIFAVSLTDFSIGGGQTLTLHFSLGTSTPTDIYLGLGSDLAVESLKPGTRVVLVDQRAQIASVYTVS